MSEAQKQVLSKTIMSQTHEERMEYNKKRRDSKIMKVLNKIVMDGKMFSFDLYEEYRHKYFPKSPRITKYFSSEAEVTTYFQINHKVAAIEFIHYDTPVPVYDISVDTYHNFYVAAGVLLHNCFTYAH